MASRSPMMREAVRAQYVGCRSSSRAAQAARAMAKAIERDAQKERERLEVFTAPTCGTCDGFQRCEHLAHHSCRAGAGAARKSHG